VKRTGDRSSWCKRLMPDRIPWVVPVAYGAEGLVIFDLQHLTSCRLSAPRHPPFEASMMTHGGASGSVSQRSAACRQAARWAMVSANTAAVA
jgi:hypothetical protein